ncbi:MAG: efflux RND transporter periplasmic adaptor subunit [Campylobacterota bacterium]|nr:efflux RND transporter periplasmic adaptor subunit [Campylobacterota bacterium]
MIKVILSLLLILGSTFAFELQVTGTVISDNQKMIGARYMGYVKKIHYDIGDEVEREDTLFEIESAEFDILKNQADLFLEQAKIMVDMYRSRMSEIRREKRILKSRGLGDSMDFENLDMAADNVSASLASAQSLLNNATEKIKQVATITDYLEVKAPNDGIIVEKRIRVGDLIAPGMLAMILVDLNHLEIHAEIAESDMRYVDRGQSVAVSIPSLGYDTKGVVKSIVPSANPMAHTFKIVVSFYKGNDKIYPGMYAKLKIDIKARQRTR